MPDKEDDHRWQTQRRDEMWGQGVRGLLLVNGGAIVALLAFLQAIWTSAAPLIPWIVSGLIPLAFGVAAVAPIPLLRAETVLFWTDAGGRGKRMMRLYRRLAAGSVVLFVVGVAILIVGVFANLPPAAIETQDNVIAPL